MPPSKPILPVTSITTTSSSAASSSSSTSNTSSTSIMSSASSSYHTRKYFYVDSLLANVHQECVPYFWRKWLIFWLVFLVAWTCTKIPYYIQFNPRGGTKYEHGGLTGSINLVFWFGNGLNGGDGTGYDSSKLHSPACNFHLIHIAFGITVLIMSALTLVKSSWRRKYGYYFFTFAICLASHTIPAAWTMTSTFLKYLFTFDCLLVIFASVFGMQTLFKYNSKLMDPIRAEKYLVIAYSIVTFGSYGAGFAESSGILYRVIYRYNHGEWKQYGHDPHPMWGHMIYDALPESCGMTFFFLFAAIFWFWWPIKLLSIDTSTNHSTFHTYHKSVV